MSDKTTRCGSAVYFDGITAARHIVTVACAASGIEISDSAGSLIAHWPCDRVVHVDAPAGLMRLGLRDNATLARLDIRDPGLMHAVDRACTGLGRAGVRDRAERRGALFWSLAAVASLLLVALYGLPEIADRMAHYLPPQVERNFGRAADIQFRTTFDQSPRGKLPGRPFECGGGPGEAAGKKAFDTLIARVAKGAGLEVPIRAVVVRREEPNAFALAGGYVYVLKGLIDNAQNVDEVAAIVAHEFGHIANRDGTRSIVQSAGISLIFGMLLGDFVGGAAVVVAAQSLFKAAHSRMREAAADDFAMRTLQELGANPRALATFLERMARDNPRAQSIFLGHPSIAERVARIDATPLPHRAGPPLLDAAEWQVLRRICAGYP